MRKKYLYFIINTGLIIIPILVLAQGGTGLTNPLGYNSFGALIKAITKVVVEIGAALAVIFIIWSGFLFVTANGSDEKIKKAKSTLTWTIIGIAVLLGATVISEVVVNFVKGAS